MYIILMSPTVYEAKILSSRFTSRTIIHLTFTSRGRAPKLYLTWFPANALQTKDSPFGQSTEWSKW